MAGDKISPEEKLLSLIKNDKRVGEKKGGVGPPKKERVSRKTFGILRDKYLRGFTRHGGRPLLMFIIILLFCAIGYNFYFSIGNKGRIDFPHQEVRREKKKIQDEPISLKPYSYYAQKIGGKSLFSPMVIETPKAAIENVEKIEEMCKNYRLKGIIMGERPEAFIEDSKTRRTLTVTIGGAIGKVQVKDIKEGKVILSYGNETYDLFF